MGNNGKDQDEESPKNGEGDVELRGVVGVEEWEHKAGWGLQAFKVFSRFVFHYHL